MSIERTAPGSWRTGQLESYNAYTGEREMFIYRLPPNSQGETAHNRICIRGGEEMDNVADAAFIVLADHHFDRLEQALRESTAQLEYLHDKFEKTGTTEAVLTRNRAVIAAIDKEREGR